MRDVTYIDTELGLIGSCDVRHDSRGNYIVLTSKWTLWFIQSIGARTYDLYLEPFVRIGRLVSLFALRLISDKEDITS